MNRNIRTLLRITATTITAAVSVLLYSSCSKPESEAGDKASNGAPDNNAPTIADLYKTFRGLNGFISLVAEYPHIEETLATRDKRYTLFAPSDPAFEETRGRLMGLSKEQIEKLLLYHIYDGQVSNEEFVDGQELVMMSGHTLIARDSYGVIFFEDGLGIKRDLVFSDQFASNGIIHLVDAVMLPPEN